MAGAPFSPRDPWPDRGTDGSAGLRGRTRIDLCGRLVARIDDHDVAPDLPGHQARALFAFLVLNRGRPVTRDELVLALWPDNPPASPATGLSSVLARVRRTVGADVIAGRTQLSLNLAPDAEIDVELIGRAVEEAAHALAVGDPHAAAAAADSGLELAHGRLLPGLDLPWVEAKRRELGDLEDLLSETRVRAGLAIGGDELAVAERVARTLTASGSLRESHYELLMEAQERRGNVAEAIVTFDRLRALLRDELGASPSAGVMARHARLLRYGGSEPAAATNGTLDLPERLKSSGDRLFVGRLREFERLRAAWQKAKAGRQQVAVLVGAPGIGKTRLAGRFAAEVHAEQVTVLYGRCDEETVIPYQPFVEAIGQYLKSSERGVDDDIAPELRALGQLVPEVRRLAGEGQYNDPDTQRYLLFEAVTRLLLGWARERALLLVLDDLHWAEKPTLLLLRHALRERGHAPLMVLAILRDGAHSEEVVADLLLEREDRGDKLGLDGLDDAATNAIVAARLDVPATGGFVRALRAKTDGNPFFIEEALRSLTESSPLAGAETASERLLEEMRVPQRVQELTLRRLRRLSQPAADALNVAAVIARAGGDFDLDLLEAVLDEPWTTVQHGVDEATDNGLVVELAQVPKYTFCHALVRDAIYSSLRKNRRLGLHQRVGDALEARSAGAAEIAYHFWTARELVGGARTIPYAERAGAEAARELAYEEAATHFKRALEASEPPRPVDEERRCDLLLALGRVQWQGGDLAARDSYREVAASAQRRGAAKQLARAVLGLGERYWEADVDGLEYRGYLITALQPQMTGNEDSVQRVRLLGRLAEHLHFTGEQETGLARSLEAVEMGRRLEAGCPVHETDRRAAILLALVSALKGRHVALLDIAHLDERLSLIAEMRSLRGGRRELSGEILQWWLHDLLELGEVGRARTVHADLEKLAQELHQPLFQHVSTAWRGVFAQLDGDVEAAIRLAKEAHEHGLRANTRDADSTYAAQRFSMERHLGLSRDLLDDIEALTNGPIATIVWRAALAVAHLESGAREEGAAAYERFARRDFDSIPRGFLWLPSTALLAEACAMLEDRARAQALYDRLLPFAQRQVQVGLAICWGSVERQLGLLAATLGDTERAEAHVVRALEHHRSIQAPLLTAVTECDYAALLRQRGDHDRAAELGAAAETLARARGLDALAARAAAMRA